MSSNLEKAKDPFLRSEALENLFKSKKPPFTSSQYDIPKYTLEMFQHAWCRICVCLFLDGDKP